jgi:glycosyltransferase involved in cell wall biosynthesis
MKFGRFSLMRLKMGILRIMQTRSFLKADGIIFLSEYAKNKIQHNSDEITCSSALIPHGIESRFFQSPRYHRNIDKFSFQFPFRFLYVSILMPYKHQIEVAIAVAYLRGQGLPIEMYFIGGSWGNYGLKFQSLLRELDPEAIFLLYEGHVEFDDLHARYRGADAFVFASSCENLPNILIEAMASGLPIACSNRGPMPEILGSAGVYFDPESPSSIAEALLGLFKDDELRKSLALKAWHSAQKYSWELCAKDTLRFISKVAQFKGQRS